MPVIRYLEGSAGGDQPASSNLAHAFYDTKPFTNTNAYFYYGNFAPSFQSSYQDPLRLTDKLLGAIDDFWDWFLKKLMNVAETLFHDLKALETDIIGWIKEFVRLASIPPLSWNHAKIFSVNGKTLITGGANYWGDYGTGAKWLFDLSMSITGDAAADAHEFANYLWGYLNNIPSTDKRSFSQRNLLTGDINGFKAAQAPLFSDCPQNTGDICVLSTGKNGNWPLQDPGYPADAFNGVRDFLLSLLAFFIETKYKKLASTLTVSVATLLDDDEPLFRTFLKDVGINPAIWASRYARNYTIKNAQRCIRLSQQKIVMDDLVVNSPGYRNLLTDIKRLIGSTWDGYIWPYDTLMAMGYALSNISYAPSPIGIQLVSSNPDVNSGYEDPVSKQEFTDRLAEVMTGMQTLNYIKPNGSIEEVIKKFDYRRVDNQSPNPLYGNHSKLVIVDDSVCYIGSDNAYPCYCQEFGVWIDDQASLKSFLSNYWDGLWNFAKPTS